MISLTSFTYLVAEKDMPCDAFKIWCDVVETLDVKEKQKGLSTWFYAWKGIESGTEYLEYSFDVVDEETGELTPMVLNVTSAMNKIMVKNNWYPKSIQQAFKKYKN